MTEYGVQSAGLHEAIHVGRLNKTRTEFLDKADCTDMVLAAVARYVEDNYHGGLGMTFPGLGLEMFVQVKPLSEKANSDGVVCDELDSTGRRGLMAKYRKKPVEIEAIRYDGNNHEEVYAFTGEQFFAIEPEDRADDPDLTAEVYDKLHSTWVGVKDGQWIICGVQGEYYPCDPDVFAATYEAVSDD